MTALSVDTSESAAPNDADAALARDCAQRLARHIARSDGSVELRVVEPDGIGDTVSIPASAARLLLTILAEMASGNGLRLIPHQSELTTQEAAELLNFSRPYVVRLLEEGKIPFRRVGTHRRVLFRDVLAYKERQRHARKTTLDRLSVLDQELGLT